MSNALRRACLALLFLTISIGMVAQVETGSISGAVKDPSGAVIPAAQITVKNVATGAVRTITSNADGLYNVTNLQPGTYQVTVEHSGFSKIARQIVVSVGSKNSADFAMEIGGSSTTVEVVGAGATQVNTESQSLSDVVTPKQVAAMPSLNRNPYDLVQLSGNVTGDSGEGATNGRGVGVAINGQRSASTNVTLDGADNVDEFTAGVGQAVPQDSVSEFRVITSDFGAEYGRASGGVVNVTTKSGTNSFHGSAYEYYRGSGLATNTYDANANGQPKARFDRNQFGYSLGGPVKKDKLFFFNNTEWARVRSSQMENYWVPDPAFINAAAANTKDFMSQYGKLAPGAQVIGSITKDELFNSSHNKAGLPNGPHGTSAAYALLAGDTPIWDKVQLAQPSDAGGGSPQNETMSVSRVDYNFSNNTQMFFRYGLQKVDYFAGYASASPYDGFNTGEQDTNNNFLVSVTHVFSPNLVSQSKVTFNRLNDVQPLNGDPTPSMYYQNKRSSFGGYGAALPGYLPFSPGSAIPFGGPQNLAQFYQDVSWTKGKHEFRFGGQYIYTRDNRAFGAYEEAIEQLGTTVNSGLDGFLNGTNAFFKAAVNPEGAQPCTKLFPGNAFYSDPEQATAIYNVTPGCEVTLPATAPQFSRSNRYNDFALYGQDSWKVVPRFTLNLGLRWEYYGVQHNKNPKLDSNFVYGPGSNWYEAYANGETMRATDPGNPNHGLWKPDYNNFGPRIGFAWDVFGDGKTSVRGGYGISYERNFGNVTYNVIQNPPNYAVISLMNIPVTNSNFGPMASGSGTTFLPASSIRDVNQNIQTAYAATWSLALQREIARNTVASVEYSGSRGFQLYTLEDPNRPGSGVIYGGQPTSIVLPVGTVGSTTTAGIGGYTCSTTNSSYSAAANGCVLDNSLAPLSQYYGPGSYLRENKGFSYYNAMTFKVQSSNLFNTGLMLTANYTWSHAIDNLSSTFSDSYANYNVGLLDPFNPNLDKGNADFDMRHRVVISGVWDMPFFKSTSNGFLKNTLGGWTLTPTFTAHTGTPYTLFDCTNGYEYCSRALITAPLSANGNAGVTPVPDSPNEFNYLNYTADVGGYYNPLTNTSDFGDCTVPGQGVNGPCPYPSNMVGRNTERGPGYWGFDMGITKHINVTERMKLDVTGAFFNMFNHPNLYVDDGTLDAYGGTTVQAKKGMVAGSPVVTDHRNIQLGVRLSF